MKPMVAMVTMQTGIGEEEEDEEENERQGAASGEDARRKRRGRNVNEVQNVAWVEAEFAYRV